MNEQSGNPSILPSNDYCSLSIDTWPRPSAWRAFYRTGTFILRYRRTVFYRVRFLFFCTAQGPIFRSRCRRRNWTVSRTLGLFDTVNRTAHTVFWAPYRTEFYVRNRRPQYENTTSVRFRTYCDGIAKKSDRGSDPVDPTSFSTTVGF